jgi:hypothetical protein
MIKLKHLLVENEEEIQMYVDIISMNPSSPAYTRYKKILKDKFGIDYDKVYGDNDESLIRNASLDNIKSKNDFLNFQNYQIYAKEIFKLRKLLGKLPRYIDKTVGFDVVEGLGKRLGFKVKERPYTGSGNYAQASTDKLEVPNPVDVNTLIHEMGHVYHYKHYGDGISSTITNASSHYELTRTDEVFAENFTHFFIAPSYLKSNLPHVYSDLNSKIKPNWKSEIQKILKK